MNHPGFFISPFAFGLSLGEVVEPEGKDENCGVQGH